MIFWPCVLVAFLLLILVHELGHAVVALVLTDGEVTVQTAGPAWIDVRVGRLRLRLGLSIPLRAGRAAWVSTEVPVTRPMQVVAFVAAGPAASVLAAAASFAVAAGASGRLALGGLLVGADALWSAVANAVPRRQNDGALVVAALRRRSYEALRLRWAQRVTTKDEGRAPSFPGVFELLALPRTEPTPSHRAAALLAIAGWCWRRTAPSPTYDDRAAADAAAWLDTAGVLDAARARAAFDYGAAAA